MSDLFPRRAVLFRRLYVLWMLLSLALPAAGAAAADGADAQAPTLEPDTASITVWGRAIATLRMPYEQMSVQERAERAAQRILAIPAGQQQYKVEASPATLGKYSGAWITVNSRVVFGVMDTDADTAGGESLATYCTHVTDALHGWLLARDDQYYWPHLLRDIGLSLAATAAYFLVMFATVRYARRWSLRREASAHDPGRTLKISDVNVRPYLIALETGLYRFFTWGIGLALGYLWLTFCLRRFPYSQPWGDALNGFLLNLFGNLVLGVVQSIPDLFTVFVIMLLTRLIAKVVRAFFLSAERGDQRARWLEPETARATRRIVSVLIWIFALVVAYPYIPGSGTEAFKGVSVFLGLMVSLGSAGMVGQVVGGLVVVYTRAFQTGDHIRVGEHEGIVREIGVLSTKIETRRREEITLPNAVLVGATTVNYSRLARQRGGVIIATKVTIGYDTPWRQVHAMLEMAARRTAGVRETPPPRVMQSALSDFYPEYTLLMVIDRSEDRYGILSELHGHIQDVFNEFGVQIMSPNFVAQPEKALLVSREHWFDAPARET